MERFKSRKWVRWVLIAVIVVCLVPIPVSWNKTLNATKLDSEANILGTVQIPLTGTRWISLLMANHLNVKMGPVEHIPIITVNTHEFDHRVMEDFLSLSAAVMYTPLEGSIKDAVTAPGGPTSLNYAYHIYLSPDHDRWLIHIVEENELHAFYIGSLSGKYTTQELLDYFGHIAPPMGE